MFTLTQPDDDRLRRLVERLDELPLSYPAGLLRRPGIADGRGGRIADGWFVDRFHAVVGHGADDFAFAEMAVRDWAMFEQDWTTTPMETPSIELGNVIGYGAHVLGGWWSYGCRIVEVIDERNRFGFVYGTVLGHAERGEERFQVELRDNGDVVFSLLAASRPGRWFAWPGLPIARRAQRRFRPGAAKGVRRALARHRAAHAAAGLC